jgi:hypothetical protein
VAQAAIIVWVRAGGFGGGVPFLAEDGWWERTKADGPAFEEDYFYGGRGRGGGGGGGGGVDLFPPRLGDAVALAGEGRLVILGDFRGLRLREGREDGEGEGDIVGGGLAAVLEERVVGVGVGEGDLVGVG